MGLPNWREHISPNEAYIPSVPLAPKLAPVKPKPKAKPKRPVYVEIACPQCLVKQQAANRCVNCRSMIVWRIDELMQSQIQRAYNLTGRNAKAAAKLLGIPYRTFWTRLQQYKATSLSEVEP